MSLISVRIASFDIGRRNFAFYVEDVDTQTISVLRDRYIKLPKKYQRRAKGVMNEHIDAMLDEMYKQSTAVENGYGVFDFTVPEDRSLTIDVRFKMQSLLRSYMWLWETCDIIVIEQQFFNPRSRATESRGANMDAIKLGESCFSWFVDTFYPFKRIEYFGSMWKTTTLGAPESILKKGKWVKFSKADRKSWSVMKAMEISELRKDSIRRDMFLKGTKGIKKRTDHKMDDIADCLIQCQAYKFRKFIAEGYSN